MVDVLTNSKNIVTVRRAVESDAAEIANVHINSWREAYRGLLPQKFLDDRPLNFRNRYELWKKVTANKAQATFVAESQDHGVIGFINGAEARDRQFKEYAEVWCIYLLQRYHKQGIGFRLLQEYFESAVELGFRKAYLWVLKNNPTIAFYERSGAISTGDIKCDEIGGQQVEELCYVWKDIVLLGKTSKN